MRKNYGKKKLASAKSLKKAPAKNSVKKIVKSSVKSVAKIRAVVAKLPKKILPTAQHAAQPIQTKSSFGHARSVVVWTFVLALVFASLSLMSSYSDSNEKQTSLFQSKLAQVATLSLPVADEDGDMVSLIATGSVSTARYTELRMRRANDYTLPFHSVADFLKSADITFGNLEAPLFRGLNTPEGSTTLRADLRSIEGLLYAGYDVLSLANNHTMNYQVPGLTSTIQELKKAGIAYAGAGKNIDAAHAPVMFDVKGKKIAFYAYNDSTIPPGRHGEATANTPGIAKMDIETVKNDVKNALAGGADFVVVSMHAGFEYKKEPTKFQKDFAYAAIDAGASAVIGHHAHIVQPVEHYGNGVIFHSLGNFVFDQFFSEDVQTGLIAKILFEEKGKAPKVELFPVKLENTVPRILEGEERMAMLEKLGLLMPE